jgi:hypothetical protein
MKAGFPPVRIGALGAIATTLLLFLFDIARGADDELARAFREDKQNCSTLAGLEYQMKFLSAIGPTLFPALQTCAAGKKYDFDLAFIVSADGHIRRVVHATGQPVAECLAIKLKGKSVPRPPRDAWSVAGHYGGKP